MIIKTNQNELLDILKKYFNQDIEYIEMDFIDYDGQKGSYTRKINISKTGNFNKKVNTIKIDEKFEKRAQEEIMGY